MTRRSQWPEALSYAGSTNLQVGKTVRREETRGYHYAIKRAKGGPSSWIPRSARASGGPSIRAEVADLSVDAKNTVDRERSNWRRRATSRTGRWRLDGDGRS